MPENESNESSRNGSTVLSAPTILADAVRKVCVGPHLSKDLSRGECAEVMSAILNFQATLDPVQMGLFLVGMRMKRETSDENAGIYDALADATPTLAIDIPDLLHLTDPFDGQKRHLPAGLFMAPIFASCGLPTLVQSVPTMGPKYGVTPEQILAMAGGNVDKTPAETAADLQDMVIRWGYLSQRQATPALWDLQDLRIRMLKRPTLSTLEKLLRPIQARRDWLLTGYIHKAYRETVPQMARVAGCHSCLAQRGVEGSVTPPLSRDSHIAWMSTHREEVEEASLSPEAVGLSADIVAPALPDDAPVAAALAAGRAALQGQDTPTARAMWLQVGQVLWRGHSVDSLEAGIEAARTRCRTGLAWDHWQALTGDQGA
jgi:anthranilate phosphoribosyltransferase